MVRLTRGVLLALLCAGLAALGLSPTPASAAGGSPTGLVRMMHLSPDTPAVDAYIDSVSVPGVRVVLPAVSYGDVSAYQTVPAGTYTVSARAAGADPTSPPVLATTFTVAAGTATTVAGVGHFADLGFTVLPDSLALPPAGQARVRVINAAVGGSPLTLTLGGTTLTDGLAFAAAGDYVDVPGGAGTLSVTGSGVDTQLPVQVAPGSVYTLLVLDRSGGGLQVKPTLDSASPGVVPVGGVETGAGGTAGTTDGGLPAGRLALAALAVTALALATRSRLSPRSRPARHGA